MGVCDYAGEGDVKYVRYYQFCVMVYCSIYSPVASAPRSRDRWRGPIYLFAQHDYFSQNPIASTNEGVYIIPHRCYKSNGIF